MLFLTGQLDPVTKKGYNWAMVPDNRIYAGLGLELVGMQTLLTDTKYNKLALLILNDKSLKVESIVREESNRFLQQ
jgi:hypothetical protein